MQFGKWLIVSVFLLAASNLAWPQAPQGKADPSANAALRYWRAFDAMAGLSKEQGKLLEDWQKVPLDQASATLVKDSSALTEFHRGAKAPYCDWGLEYDDGPNMMFNHVVGARTLSRLACLRARWKFHEGKTSEAVEDVAAAFILARHIGKDPTLISILVNYTIEQMAIEAVQPNFAKLDPASLKTLSIRIDTLPHVATIPQCLVSEREYMAGWLIKRTKEIEAEPPADWREQLGRMLGGDQSLTKPLFTASQTPQEVRRLAESLVPVYDEMARLTKLPRQQFDTEFAALMARDPANSPLGHLLLPAVGKAVARQEKARVQLTLFRAALAIAQGGPEMAKEFPDPAGSGSVTYKPIGGGFAVQSQLRDEKGEPVTFYAGQAPRQHPSKK